MPPSDDSVSKITPESWRRFEEQQRAMAEQARGGGGGGGGVFGGTEERVIRLEGDVGRMKTDVAELRSEVGKIKNDLTTLMERVAHLPSKTWIFSVLVGLLSAFSAITGLLIRFLPHSAP